MSRKKQPPLPVSIARRNLSAVISKAWGARQGYGDGYPAVEVAEAIAVLEQAVRADKGDSGG